MYWFAKSSRIWKFILLVLGCRLLTMSELNVVILVPSHGGGQRQSKSSKEVRRPWKLCPTILIFHRFQPANILHMIVRIRKTSDGLQLKFHYSGRSVVTLIINGWKNGQPYVISSLPRRRSQGFVKHSCLTNDVPWAGTRDELLTRSAGEATLFLSRYGYG